MTSSAASSPLPLSLLFLFLLFSPYLSLTAAEMSEDIQYLNPAADSAPLSSLSSLSLSPSDSVEGKIERKEERRREREKMRDSKRRRGDFNDVSITDSIDETDVDQREEEREREQEKATNEEEKMERKEPSVSRGVGVGVSVGTLLQLWNEREEKKREEEGERERRIMAVEESLKEQERERGKRNEEKRERVTEQLRQQREDEQADREELSTRSLSNGRNTQKWHSNRRAKYGNPHRIVYDEKEESEIRTLQQFISQNENLQSMEEMWVSHDLFGSREQRTRDRFELSLESKMKRTVTTVSQTSSSSGRFLSPPSVLLSVSNVPINSDGSAQCHTLILFSVVAQIYVPTYLTNSGNVTLRDFVPPGSTLKVGSVETSIGRIIEGNNDGDESVTVDIGDLPIGTSFVKVTFFVTLDGNFDGIGILYGNVAIVTIDFWGDTKLLGNDAVFYSCDEPPPFHVPPSDDLDSGEIAATVILSVFGFLLLLLLLLFVARGNPLSGGDGSYFSSNDTVTPVEESDPRYADGRTNLQGPNVSDTVKREYVDTTLNTEKEVDLGIEQEIRSSKSRPGLGGALATESSSMRDYRGGVSTKT